MGRAEVAYILLRMHVRDGCEVAVCFATTPFGSVARRSNRTSHKHLANAHIGTTPIKSNNVGRYRNLDAIYV